MARCASPAPGTPAIQLGTAYPGFNGGFEFKNVPVNPGGTITYTADYGAPGNAPLTHYTGTGSHKFEPFCLIFGATWHGTMTEDKSCTARRPERRHRGRLQLRREL